MGLCVLYYVEYSLYNVKKSRTFLSGLELHFNPTKRQVFRLVQIESICRQQNKCNLKTEILFGMGKKHCGKRRKC